MCSHGDSRVLVTGGGGYVGSTLVPRLAEAGFHVTVLDRFFFGRSSLREMEGAPSIRLLAGDIRDENGIEALFQRERFDQVIHLAAISNDPCSDLDPELTRSVNLTGTEIVMRAAKRAGVKRFLYASSASVYGIKVEEDVTEDLPLSPLTLYARYKAEGEEILAALSSSDFVGVSVRAATLCGYSPRLRMDLTVNILTGQAVLDREIRVFGGSQMRPNLHVRDLAELYLVLLTADAEKINGRAFNVSAANASVRTLAEAVRDEVDPAIPITAVPTQDLRSYRLNSERLRRTLGFSPKRTVGDAIRDLAAALRDGRVSAPRDLSLRNVELMKAAPEAWLTVERSL